MQANYGARELLRVDGVAVGRAITLDEVPSPRPRPPEGSIIVVLATDAPLLAMQCQRLARRATTGLAWVGGIGANSSGDIFLAFATGNRIAAAEGVSAVRMLAPSAMTRLFQAAAEATEEAILNALCMAETMVGQQGRVAHAIPHERLIEVVRARADWRFTLSTKVGRVLEPEQAGQGTGEPIRLAQWSRSLAQPPREFFFGHGAGHDRNHGVKLFHVVRDDHMAIQPEECCAYRPGGSLVPVQIAMGVRQAINIRRAQRKRSGAGSAYCALLTGR